MDRGICCQDIHQPKLLLTDPPVVTEEKWIEAHAKLVQKMGALSLVWPHYRASFGPA
jgi:hypothetical protein